MQNLGLIKPRSTMFGKLLGGLSNENTGEVAPKKSPSKTPIKRRFSIGNIMMQGLAPTINEDEDISNEVFDTIANRRNQTQSNQPRNMIEEIAYSFVKATKQHITELEVERLVTFLKKFPFFDEQYQKISQADQKVQEYNKYIENIAENLIPEIFPANTPIFNHGDAGYKVYFVCQGECNIYVPKSVKEIEDDKRIFNDLRSAVFDEKKSFLMKFDRDLACQILREHYAESVITAIKNNDFFDKHFKLIITHWWKFKAYYLELLPLLASSKPGKYYQEGIFLFKKIKTIKQGGCFGEIALINDVKRAASILSWDKCKQLSLTKKDFKKIFSNIKVIDEEKRQYLDNLFQKQLTKAEVIDIMYSFSSETFSRHKPIFKEGDPIENIYLLHKGEIQVQMDIRQPTITNKLGRKIPQPNKACNLEIIGSSSNFFGHDDILLGKQYRTYSAIALSDKTLIYKISLLHMPKIMIYIKNFFPNLLNNCLDKITFRNERLAYFGEPVTTLTKPDEYNWETYTTAIFKVEEDKKDTQNDKEKSKTDSNLEKSKSKKKNSEIKVEAIPEEQILPDPENDTAKLFEEIAKQKSVLAFLKEAGLEVDLERYMYQKKAPFPKEILKEKRKTGEDRNFVSSYGNVLGNSKIYGSNLMESIKRKLEEKHDKRGEFYKIKTLLDDPTDMNDTNVGYIGLEDQKSKVLNKLNLYEHFIDIAGMTHQDPKYHDYTHLNNEKLVNYKLTPIVKPQKDMKTGSRIKFDISTSKMKLVDKTHEYSNSESYFFKNSQKFNKHSNSSKTPINKSNFTNKNTSLYPRNAEAFITDPQYQQTIYNKLYNKTENLQKSNDLGIKTWHAPGVEIKNIRCEEPINKDMLKHTEESKRNPKSFTNSKAETSQIKQGSDRCKSLKNLHRTESKADDLFNYEFTYNPNLYRQTSYYNFNESILETPKKEICNKSLLKINTENDYICPPDQFNTNFFQKSGTTLPSSITNKLTGDLKINTNFSKFLPKSLTKYATSKNSNFSKSQNMTNFNQLYPKPDTTTDNGSIFEQGDDLKQRLVNVYNITSKDDICFKNNHTYTDLKRKRDLFVKINKGKIEGCIDVPQLNQHILQHNIKSITERKIYENDQQIMRKNKNSRIFVIDINKMKSKNILRNITTKGMNYYHNDNIGKE